MDLTPISERVLSTRISDNYEQKSVGTFAAASISMGIESILEVGGPVGDEILHRASLNLHQ